jgi:hypothetical protein
MRHASLPILVVVAFVGFCGTAGAQDRSRTVAPAAPIEGNPQDRTAKAVPPSDSELLAQCIVREQADHTGLSAKEAEANCRERLTRKGPPR